MRGLPLVALLAASLPGCGEGRHHSMVRLARGGSLAVIAPCWPAAQAVVRHDQRPHPRRREPRRSAWSGGESHRGVQRPPLPALRGHEYEHDLRARSADRDPAERQCRPPLARTFNDNMLNLGLTPARSDVFVTVGHMTTGCVTERLSCRADVWPRVVGDFTSW